MTTITSYLSKNVGGILSPYVGAWVRLRNNSTQSDYISTTATDVNGKFTVNTVPAGTYTVYTGTSAGSTPTATGNSNFTVEDVDGSGNATIPGTLTVNTGPLTLPAASIADAALSGNVVLKDNAQTITGVKHFSAAPIFDAGFTVSAGTVTFAVAPTFSLGANFPSGAGIVFFGAGDDVSYYVGGTPFEMDARQGTVASPILTGSGPTFKISRTESITAASMPAGIGSNNQGNAGLWVSATGDAANEVQVNAILGTATTQSTVVAGGGKNHDCVGVQGFGSVFGSGLGTGGGGYFEGRRDTNTGNANGIEVRTRNQTATDGVYNSTGFSNTVGVWVTADGQTNRVSGVAIGVGIVAANSAQWDVGIGFTTMSGISSVKTTTFSDDTSSVNSIIINGTHTRALGIKSGAGAILVGHPNATDAATNSGVMIETFSSSSLDPHIAIQGSGNVDATMKLGNSSGSARLFVVGFAGSQLTSSAIGDCGFRIGTAAKRLLFGGTSIVISVKNDNTLGFFGATETAQIAGATDVLAGLVTLGLRAASSNPPLNLGTGAITSGGHTFGDATDIVVGTGTGTKVGTAITQKLGFYNATPIAQRAGAAQVAVATTASTNTTPFGYTTAAQADAIVTLANELRAWAVAQGFIKGAA